jgi:hypothetical protein
MISRRTSAAAYAATAPLKPVDGPKPIASIERGMKMAGVILTDNRRLSKSCPFTGYNRFIPIRESRSLKRQNSTRTVNFPHAKRSSKFNRFRCVAATHRYEPVDNHNT